MKLKRFIIIYLTIGLNTMVCSQDVTYFKDIEPIIKKNCASCHKIDGYGPFPLTTYNEVKDKGSFIAYVTESKYMPPWKADPEFRSFKNERGLSKEEIEKIKTWVDLRMPKGKKKGKSTPIPSFMENRKPDLILEMNQPYELSNEGIEDYRFFNLPSNLAEDVYIESINYVPGNKKRVHHSRIMADTTNLIRGIDGLSEFDPKAITFQENPLADEFLYGWVPGNLPVIYPSGTGKKIHANTDFILNIHYAPTSAKHEDSSKIELYFAKEEVKHDIKSLPITEAYITNKPFVIRADKRPIFYARYVLREDAHIVSVLPHMHFLGKTFKAIATTPSGEVIPLIKINDWDFNWQSTYLYKEPLLVPRGSVILVTATYDNTSENPINPNSPPKDVTYGWNSTDEMMNLILYYY